MERWAEIPGATGYMVSDHGRVKSARKVLKPFRVGPKGKQYLAVDIHRKTVRVHRLVCAAFHGEPPADKPEVNHRDGNKENNHYRNLEWSSGSDNVLHAFNELGRSPSGGHTGKTGNAHHSSRSVVATNIESGEIRIFGSTGEAARELGIGAGSVPRCCNGIYASSKGWAFAYREQHCGLAA